MKSVMPIQLCLEFVDSPQGSDPSGTASELDVKDWLRHKSKRKKKPGITTAAADTSRLLDEVASEANLAKALLHVANNKGAAGVDGKSVEEVMAQAYRLLPRLSRQLLNGLYRSGEIKRVVIPKPGGGERGLGVPNVIDRWVQQAIHQVLAPLYEVDFHRSSHGFRPARGAQTAIREAKAFVSAGKGWVVSVDLSKFFDRVNHQRLLSRLARKINDKRILRLIHQMLKAKVVLPDGTRVSVEEGTPQGGPLSPLLSNIVLDELDWELERRGLSFVRYADDLNVFVRSERAGARVMEGLTRFIERRLRLKVNEDKTVVDRPEDVHILGFSLRRKPVEKTTEVLLSKKTIIRIRNKVKELTPRNWGQSFEALFRKANEYLEGWVGYFSLCSEEGARTFKVIDAHFRRRVRCIVIRRFHRQRFLRRHLIQRGVSKVAAAKFAYSSRGSWSKSFNPVIHKAYPNRWFSGQLCSLWEKWLLINIPPTEAVSGQLLLSF